jgi:hypothetical protein
LVVYTEDGQKITLNSGEVSIKKKWQTLASHPEQ